MEPYGSMAARTVLFHSLAFNEPLKGLSRLELNYSLYAPAVDPAFVDKAVRLLQEQSEYLDDSGTSKLRFLTDANLNQMVRNRKAAFDLTTVRDELNRRIKHDLRQADGWSLCCSPAARPRFPTTLMARTWP